MSSPTCALCYAIVKKQSMSVTTNASCKHTFHVDCVKVRLCMETSEEVISWVRECCVHSCPQDCTADRKRPKSVRFEIAVAKTEPDEQPHVENEGAVGPSPAKLQRIVSDAYEDVVRKSVPYHDPSVFLKVSGLPEKVAAVDDGPELFQKLMTLLKIPKVSFRDVVKLERIGTVNPATTSCPTFRGHGGRALRLELKSRDIRDRIVSAYGKLPVMMAFDIDDSLPPTRVYVNDSSSADEEIEQLRNLVSKQFRSLASRGISFNDAAVHVGKFPRVIEVLPTTDLRQLGSQLDDDYSPSYLNVCGMRVDSLPNDHNKFKMLFSRHLYHVIAVTRTRLDQTYPDDHVALNHYELCRADRKNQRRVLRMGGVALYVSKLLNVNTLESSTTVNGETPEYLIAEIWGGSFPKILVAVIYRSSVKISLASIESKIKHLKRDYCYACVFGNFNIDLSVSYPCSTEVREFFESLDLSIVPMGPTYHKDLHMSPKDRTHCWEDICAVSDSSCVNDSGQIYQPLQSSSKITHDLIYASIDVRRVSDRNRPSNDSGGHASTSCRTIQ